VRETRPGMTLTSDLIGFGNLSAALILLGGCSGPRVSATEPRAAPSQEDLAGTWVARPSHQGESSVLALDLERSGAAGLLARWSTPALDIWDLPLGPAKVHENGIQVGPLALTYDRSAQTLSGILPDALVPVYAIPAVFHRSPPLQRTERRAPGAPVVQPVWTFDAGAPIWADAAYFSGAVLAGADDGTLHALDARTGKPLWSFRAGGSIRARPAVVGGDVLLHADDGQLYRLDAKTGMERWRVRVAAKPAVRLPIGDEKSRYDFRGSGVATGGGRLYLGTHEGRVLSFVPGGGEPIWEFQAGDSVVATPLVFADKVYFGSFDGSVYALDAASGTLIWKHDTGAPVTTSPAVHDGLVIVGSRSYDLLALDGKTGKRAWTRYYWFSWVESPATILDGSVYVGSSDAAKLFAFEGGTGRRIWEVDAGGSTWGQPAVTSERVFAGAVGTLHYLVPHRASVLAVNRQTGRPIWRYPVPPPESTSGKVSCYGFAGSPALGEGLVYFPGLDGRVYAFAQ